ncbi:hypothetical protein D9Q98_006569 [Chlorella vulgaris]|uniref:Uncharacterized protein n=1 Tax=Chlorella vulgaris TaxID=3077 RepID=A0A9D4YVD2_CHLVU|nr:hypothetical protein D9Q98_006569 [Chlorella vulgaris]
MSTPEKSRLPGHFSAYPLLDRHHDKLTNGKSGVRDNALATARKLGLELPNSKSKALREIAGMDGKDLEVCSKDAMALMQAMYGAQAAAGGDSELHFHHSNRSGEMLSAATDEACLLRLLLATAPNQGLLVPRKVNKEEDTALTYALSFVPPSLEYPSPVPIHISINAKDAQPLADEAAKRTLERHVNNGLVDTIASWLDPKGRLATGADAQQEIHMRLWRDTRLANWYTADEETLSRRPYVAAFRSEEAFKAVCDEAIKGYIQKSLEACKALELLMQPFVEARAARDAAKRVLLHSVSAPSRLLSSPATTVVAAPRKSPTVWSSKEMYKVLKLYYDEKKTVTAVGKALDRPESSVRAILQPGGAAEYLSREEFLETIFDREVKEVTKRPACMLWAALQQENWDVNSLPGFFPEFMQRALKVIFVAFPEVGGEPAVGSEPVDASLQCAAAALPAPGAAVASGSSTQLQLTGSAEGASCKGARQGAEAGEEQTAGKCVEAATEAVMEAAHAGVAEPGALGDKDHGGCKSPDVGNLALPGKAVKEEQEFVDVAGAMRCLSLN